MYNVFIRKLKGHSEYEGLTREEVHQLIKKKWRDDWEFWVCYAPIGIYWNYRDDPCF